MNPDPPSPEPRTAERILVLSGSYPRRLPCEINHSTYAARHGYEYFFDDREYPELARYTSMSFFKILATLRAFEEHEFDWLFWLDDDAFFTDLDKPLSDFTRDQPDDIFFIVCKSPVNLRGQWCYISAGQYFLRNCPESRAFFQRVLETDLEEVQRWWKRELMGLYTRGDQDVLLYLMLEHGYLAHTRLLDHSDCNSRPYHYDDTLPLRQHFLVHFAWVDHEKDEMIRTFAARFGLDPERMV